MEENKNQKTTEELLEEVHALKSALRQVISGVVMTDDQGVISFVNKKWLSIYELRQDHVIGVSLFELHKQTEAVTLRVFMKHAEAGNNVEETMDHLLSDGSRKWLLIRCMPLEESNNARFIWYVNDITAERSSVEEVKELKEKLRKTNKLLVSRQLEIKEMQEKVASTNEG